MTSFKKVVVYFRQNLIEVNPDKKLAVFQHMDTGAKVSSKKFYSLAHCQIFLIFSPFCFASLA